MKISVFRALARATRAAVRTFGGVLVSAIPPSPLLPGYYVGAMWFREGPCSYVIGDVLDNGRGPQWFPRYCKCEKIDHALSCVYRDRQRRGKAPSP